MWQLVGFSKVHDRAIMSEKSKEASLEWKERMAISGPTVPLTPSFMKNPAKGQSHKGEAIKADPSNKEDASPEEPSKNEGPSEE